MNIILEKEHMESILLPVIWFNQIKLNNASNKNNINE